LATSVAQPLLGSVAIPADASPRPLDAPVVDRRRPQAISIADGKPLVAVESAGPRRDALFRRALAVADVAAAALALILSIQVIGHDHIQTPTLLGLPLVLVVSKIIGLYDRDELVLHKSTIDEVPKLFALAAFYTLSVDILSRDLVAGGLGSDQLLGIWALLFVGAFSARTLARVVASLASQAERCIVMGEAEDAYRLAEKLAGHHSIKAEAVTTLPLKPRRDGEQRWTLESIAAAVAYHGAERLIIAPWTTGGHEILDLVRIAKGLGVKVSVLPGVFEVIGSHVEFDQLDGMTVLGVRRFELTRSSKHIKRAMDLVGSALALLFAAPLFALIAAAIAIDSRGHVFFRQVRVGRDGRRFRIWKFRTMVSDAEALKDEIAHLNQQVGLFKVTDDPRTTRVGRFLRKTSLDELPQLFNVLRGEMSLVGPRPLIVAEDSLVEGWDRRRLHLTPGMTGPWQILGGGRIPLREMVKIDYLYVTGWSLWNDVKILLQTAGYVLARRSV
jgi:exopolysaccharide biosynthesis polyprenyl glycosylphosphotransferase